MNWSTVFEATFITLLVTGILFVAKKFYIAIKNTPRSKTIQEQFEEMVNRDFATDPKLKINIKPKPNIRTITLSGTGSKLQILPGGPQSDEDIKISGTGIKQIIHVSKDDHFNIRVSGTGAVLKISYELRKSVISTRISGTGADILWR